MRRFLKQIFVFLGLSAVFYVLFGLFLLPSLLEWRMGINIEQQLEKSFSYAKTRKYDMVVMGNSRMFCGVNPDKISIPAYNFSHNNDSYNQLYWKLEWLKEHGKKIDYLVLGVDYFQFGIFSDSRNYAYFKYLGEGYQADYPKKDYRLLYYKELLRPVKVRSLFKKEVEDLHDVKPNGQYLRFGVPKEGAFIRREKKTVPLQFEYFKRILLECQANGIRVFLVMPPLREAEMRNYTPEEVANFERLMKGFLKKGKVDYFNFSCDPHFKWNDFIDFTHLSQTAADRFSTQLNDSISKSLKDGL